MKKRIFLNPIPVRIWHWVKALSFAVLIVTGLQLRYSDSLDWMSFKTAVDYHNVFGFVLFFNFFLWLGYYLISGQIKVYIPNILEPVKLVKAMINQALFYGYGIFMGHDNPHHASFDNKFNPLQQMAYLSIMFLLIPLQILTGLLMWDVSGFSVLISLVGGLKVVDTIHVLIFLFFSSFLFIHLYLASLGETPTTHLKAMIYGYEEIEDDHH
jgi:Ni/Fe-hydrogenase b-type cytochrome subunit